MKFMPTVNPAASRCPGGSCLPRTRAPWRRQLGRTLCSPRPAPSSSPSLSSSAAADVGERGDGNDVQGSADRKPQTLVQLLGSWLAHATTGTPARLVAAATPAALLLLVGLAAVRCLAGAAAYSSTGQAREWAAGGPAPGTSRAGAARRRPFGGAAASISVAPAAAVVVAEPQPDQPSSRHARPLAVCTRAMQYRLLQVHVMKGGVHARLCACMHACMLAHVCRVVACAWRSMGLVRRP